MATARKSRRQRRSFGRIIVKTSRKTSRQGKPLVYKYLEASYLVPVWAFERWPGQLPERVYKVFPMEARTDAEGWLSDVKKRIDGETWKPPKLEKAERKAATITFE